MITNTKMSLAAGCIVLLLSGCATTANNPKDPYEGFNRAMFDVNEAIDTVVARPLAQAYDCLLYTSRCV